VASVVSSLGANSVCSSSVAVKYLCRASSTRRWGGHV
jgi:hypothetical protein